MVDSGNTVTSLCCQKFDKNVAFNILLEKIYSRVRKSIENWSLWSKMALGEVGVSLP